MLVRARTHARSRAVCDLDVFFSDDETRNCHFSSHLGMSLMRSGFSEPWACEAEPKRTKWVEPNAVWRWNMGNISLFKSF